MICRSTYPFPTTSQFRLLPVRVLGPSTLIRVCCAWPVCYRYTCPPRPCPRSIYIFINFCLVIGRYPYLPTPKLIFPGWMDVFSLICICFPWPNTIHESSLKIYEYDVTKPHYVINDVITYDVAYFHITRPTKSESPQEQRKDRGLWLYIRFFENPVDFINSPVYRDGCEFSGIFPENPAGLAGMVTGFYTHCVDLRAVVVSLIASHSRKKPVTYM